MWLGHCACTFVRVSIVLLCNCACVGSLYVVAVPSHGLRTSVPRLFPNNGTTNRFAGGRISVSWRGERLLAKCSPSVSELSNSKGCGWKRKGKNIDDVVLRKREEKEETATGTRWVQEAGMEECVWKSAGWGGGARRCRILGR